jgi:MFS transporter, DHA2 family, multidrug resistance protein
MTTTPDAPAPARATRREWIGLAVIALPCLVYAMDLTVLNLALPVIGTELQPSSTQLLWIIDVYGFMVAGFLITMGTLGDRIGRRKLLLIGAAAFGVCSAVAALSNSSEMLIAMRALLGVAGATLAPSTLSLIRNMFHDEHQRQFAIGVWIASFSVGGAIGPLVGGVVLQWFGWGAAFLVAVPVMVLLLLLGPSLLPEYKDPNAGRLDLASVALSLGAVLPTIYGLKHLAAHGFDAVALALVVAGLAIGAVFVRRQARLPYPLLDITLFHNKRFAAAIAAYGLSCLAMFGVYIFIAQYLQLVLALTPLQAGLAMVPWSLTFMIVSLITPRFARRLQPVGVLVGGLATSAVGFALLAFTDGPHALMLLLVSTVVMSLGMAPVITIGNEMIITAAPPERAGAASALSETSAEFSGALGIAVFGSAGTALYRHAVQGGLPEGLSADAAAAATATLGGAVATAQAHPGPIGDALLALSRAAFTDGMQLTAWVATLVVAFASVVAARILRTREPALKRAHSGQP